MPPASRRVLFTALLLAVVVAGGFVFCGDEAPSRTEGSQTNGEGSRPLAAPIEVDASEHSERERMDASGSSPTPTRADPTTALVPGPKTELRVVDALSGEPLRRFRVNHVAVEDAEGRFEIEIGTLRSLVVDARGRIEWARAGPSLAQFLAHPPLVVPLARNPDVGLLVVRTRDTAGSPIAGARVCSTGGIDAIDERTGSSGELALDELHAGRFDLRVALDGWTDAAVAVEVVRDEGRQHAVVLERSAPCRVRITDTDGELERRLAFAVSTESDSPLPFHWSVAPANEPRWSQTHGDGEFEPERAEFDIAGLPPGWHGLHVFRGGKAVELLEFEVRAEGGTRLDARLDGPR